MHVVTPLSRHFDASLVTSPENHGEVAWSDFNRSFQRLQTTEWKKINAASDANSLWRVLRLAIAFYAQKTGAYLDLKGKAKLFTQFQHYFPANPDIVFFGAEAGSEALLLQSLLGEAGRVLLIDDDDEAYKRYEDARDELQLDVRRGNEPIVLRRERSRIEYIREDLFAVPAERQFDIAIDWGLIEHFPGESKERLINQMKRFVRPGGWHLSAVPEDTWQNRIFYRAFSDELNFGYRELMTRKEFERLWKAAGLTIAESVRLHDSVVILARHRS